VSSPVVAIESFTVEQLLDAANILLQRPAVACDCFPCRQDRMFAAMLVYCASLVSRLEV